MYLQRRSCCSSFEQMKEIVTNRLRDCFRWVVRQQSVNFLVGSVYSLHKKKDKRDGDT